MMEIKSVSNTVIEYLRSQIVTGKLRANQKLNENDLASSLGISRPPIREAFRTLENEHLVVSIPRKGTYVTNISIEDLLELCQVRKMIESYTIDLLKTKSIKELPQVESSLEEAGRLPLPSFENQDEMLYYHKVFADFHGKLIEAVSNYRIIHFYKAISLNLTRYQIMYLFIPGSVRHSLQDHREILDFIKRGEYDKAKECIENHINYTAEVLQSKILADNFKG
ncbi:MAG: GntR family transcriptional regulator [Thermodesulfobacteriota bacterium]|jgi:DNA-binding GntR family transcriptional regulator